MRDFSNHQIIRTLDSDDPNISGITFTRDSTRLLVGLEDHIQQYELDLFKRRTFPFGELL